MNLVGLCKTGEDSTALVGKLLDERETEGFQAVFGDKDMVQGLEYFPVVVILVVKYYTMLSQ